MPSTSAVQFAIVAHPSPEAAAIIRSNTRTIVVTLGGTDRDGAVKASVPGQTGTVVVQIVAHRAGQSAGTLVESTVISAVLVLHELANSTSWSCVVGVTQTLPQRANTVTITVGIAAAISLHSGDEPLFDEVIIGAEPLHGGIEPFIHILEEPPAAIFGVSARVGEVVSQHDGVVEQHLHVGQVDLPHLNSRLHSDLQVSLRGSTALQALSRFVAHQEKVVLVSVGEMGANSDSQFGNLGCHSRNNTGGTHIIGQADGEIGSNSHCVHIVRGVLAFQDSFCGVSIDCLRAHHNLQSSTASEYTTPNGRDLIGPQTQVAETCLSRVVRRQAECHSLCLCILSSGEKSSPDLIGVLYICGKMWLEVVEDQLSQFGHVVISRQVGDVDPNIFTKSVGKTNGLLPCHTVLSVRPMGQQSATFPSRISLSVGICPVHESQCSEGLQFLEHEWAEVECLPYSLESWPNHTDIPDVVVGIGPGYGHQDAVVHSGGGNHVDLHPSDTVPHCRHVVHAELQNTITVIQHHVGSIIIMGINVTGNESAHLNGRGEISRVTIAVKRDLILKCLSRAPATTSNEVDPGTTLPVHVDEGVLRGPVADALKVHPHLVLRVGRSIY